MTTFPLNFQWLCGFQIFSLTSFPWLALLRTWLRKREVGPPIHQVATVLIITAVLWGSYYNQQEVKRGPMKLGLYRWGNRGPSHQWSELPNITHLVSQWAGGIRTLICMTLKLAFNHHRDCSGTRACPGTTTCLKDMHLKSPSSLTWTFQI